MSVSRRAEAFWPVDTSGNVPGMSWNDALGAYATAQRAAGRSPGTIRLHRHYLRGLAERVVWPWAARPEDLLEYVGREGWAPETRKSARAAVRGFYRWAYGAGYIGADPGLELPTVSVPPARPRPTPEHLVKQLLAHKDRRLGFMGMLAAYGGLRAGEIARVHARDLVGDELMICGKGGKQRAVPIVSPDLLWRLRQVEGWAFPNGQGTHLSPGHVTKLISAALPDGWTAHTLRHRMATVSYAGTRDLLSVGALLGHSRPETTQRYVLLPDDAIRAAARAAVVVA